MIDWTVTDISMQIHWDGSPPEIRATVKPFFDMGNVRDIQKMSAREIVEDLNKKLDRRRCNQ